MKNLSFLIILMCSACSIDHGNFTVISNKIVDIKNLNLNKTPKVRNIEGEDLAHTIIFIPTKIPTLSAALNDAFCKSDTDLIINANVSMTYWYIPYIYGQQYWTITGTGVKTRQN